MEQLAHDFSTLEPAQPELATIKTTLGELIGAINEEVELEEDHLVAEAVLHMLETGRIKFPNPTGELSLVWTI